MASTQDYAALSLFVYDVFNRLENRPLLPTFWTELELKTDNFYGFSYGIFQGPGDEIVLAYTGTNEGIDWASNITDGLGLGSVQASAAAVVFARVREQYGTNITLTGHSLGGGLASIMSVWFNRPAVVFDHAAFELAARNPLFVQACKVALALGGFELGEFLGYDGILNFATRELNVQGHHIEGEALQFLRAAAPTIGASEALNVGEGLGTVQLHSMALYVSANLSPTFVQATLKSEHFLPVIFDPQFYNAPTKESTEKNLVIDLIRSEQANIGDGKLSHFAADLHRLGQDLTGLNEAAQKAIVAQGVEWYYWQGTDNAGQEFLIRDGALLQYSTAQGDNLPGAQKKAELYVTPWLSEVSLAHGTTLFPNFGTQQQWNVATAATTAVVAAAREQDESQIFIGCGGADALTGGHRADVIFAGAGNDTLNGGQGNDQLCGGDGTDTYQFTGLWGKDTVVDTDARSSTGKRLVIVKGGDTANTVTINNFNLTQALEPAGYLGLKLDPARQIVVKEAAGGINTWSDARCEASSLAGQGSSVVEGAAKTFTVYLNQAAQAGETLTLSLGSLGDKFKALITPAGGGAPSVVNAQGTEIDLAIPPSDARFGTYKWEATSWGADGTLTGGVAAANFSDVLRGMAGNDQLSGLGGNEAIDSLLRSHPKKRWIRWHCMARRIGAVSRSEQWLA